jgi:transposase
MMLEEEVVLLRAEVGSLKAQLAQALTRIAELEAQAEQQKSSPPPFVKASTQKRDKADTKPRRKRAKEHNGARRRERPTQVVLHLRAPHSCPVPHLPLSPASPHPCPSQAGDRVAPTATC